MLVSNWGYALFSSICAAGTAAVLLRSRRLTTKNADELNQIRLSHEKLAADNDQKTHAIIKELNASKLKASSIINAALECIVTLSSDGNITEFNPAAEHTFGYTKDEIIGKSFLTLVPKRMHEARIATFKHYFISGESELIGQRTEQIALHASGKEFPVEMTLVATEIEGETFITGFSRDITERKQSEADIHNLAFYDPLTQLPNRRLLQDRLAHALAASARHKQFSAILFIDLDNFKVLNDTRGHTVGDSLLIEAADRLMKCMRQDDTVARLGGDEFVAILEGLSEHSENAAAQVKVIAEKIADVLNQPYLLQGQEHFVSPSIGICLFGNQALSAHLSVDDLLKRADSAMYQAKQAGKNTIQFFDPAMQANLEARSHLTHELRQALAQKQLALHYQAQVNCSNQIIGAEALLRWTHPELGNISPAEFIPVAEESGLILPIGQWVLATACAQLKTWANHPSTASLKLAVNISARQFRQANFVAQLQLALGESGAPADKLKIELTESLVLDNVEDSIEKMHQLITMGIQFAMDDFGTGYSSLTYLKRLPIAQLKIDQSFVHDITVDKNDEAIVKAIIVIARTLQIDVVAEGVETDNQLAFLLNFGCHLFQGYLFSKPVPIAEFSQLLEKQA